MTRRNRHKIVLIAWLAVFFLLGFGGWKLQAGQLLLIAYFLLSVIAYIFYAFLARCPRCNVPILLRPLSIFGMDLYSWSVLAPARCRHCGKDLS